MGIGSSEKPSASLDRMLVWEKLHEGELVSICELDREFLPVVRTSSEEDRMSFVMLRTIARLMSKSPQSRRRTLHAAIVYWFSNVGSPDSTGAGEPELPAQLYDCVGARYSWGECYRMVGGNPKDHSAYRRLLRLVEQEYAACWKDVFGKTPTVAVTEMAS